MDFKLRERRDERRETWSRLCHSNTYIGHRHHFPSCSQLDRFLCGRGSNLNTGNVDSRVTWSIAVIIVPNRTTSYTHAQKSSMCHRTAVYFAAEYFAYSLSLYTVFSHRLVSDLVTSRIFSSRHFPLSFCPSKLIKKIQLPQTI